MRLTYLLLLLIPFCVLAKTVQVNFEYEMPKGINSLKYDFILKNEARKQALSEIDAGILLGKRTLSNGMFSEHITKLTPLVLSVDNLTYSRDANNHFKVKAEVNYKYDDVKQLVKSLSGMEKLKADNEALKSAMRDIETKLLTLRYKSIQKQKVKNSGDKTLKGKDAIFYVDTTSGLKFVSYTDDELKDIARFYANIVQDYFLTEINYLKPKLDVKDNKKSKTWHDEALVSLTWGFDVNLLKLQQKYKKYFDVIDTARYDESDREELGGKCGKPIVAPDLERFNYFSACEMHYWDYADPFANENKVQVISYSKIKPKLANVTTATLKKLQYYFDERIQDQMVNLYNEVVDNNYWAKHINLYTFAIRDSWLITHYRAVIKTDFLDGKILPTFKKFTVKSFLMPFYTARPVFRYSSEFR